MKSSIKKPSFWSTFRSSLSQVRNEYKELVQLEKEKRTLLSGKSDWSLLEKLIQMVNSNPDLRVDVKLFDGTVLHLKTFQPKERPSVSKMIDDVTGYYDPQGNFVVE